MRTCKLRWTNWTNECERLRKVARKQFKKRLAEIQKLLAEQVRLYNELEEDVRTLKPSPVKRERKKQLRELGLELGIVQPTPKKTLRSTWTEQEWLAEAEFQKSTMRKFQRAGDAKRARKCELAAAKAEREGRRLPALARNNLPKN